MMGVAEREIRGRSNQKLAEPISTETALSFDEVVAELRRFCRAQNAQRKAQIAERRARARNRFSKWLAKAEDPARVAFYLTVRPDKRDVLIGFGQPADDIMLGTLRLGAWLAQLAFPAGGTRVSLALRKGFSGMYGGPVQYRRAYEDLVDSLFTAISSKPDEITT
jgi:hypothetical protein